jgi:hypothetical protein
LVESRTTEAQSFRIDGPEWKDLRQEAAQQPPGLLPGMQIDIQDISLLVIDFKDAHEFFTEFERLRAEVRQLRGPSPSDDAELPALLFGDEAGDFGEDDE